MEQSAASLQQEESFFRRNINIISPLALIALVSIVMMFLSPRFFAFGNLRNIFLDASVYMVMGLGMTLVIAGKGIDLSIGSIAAFSAVSMALLIKDHQVNVYFAMIFCLLLGSFCGLINGVFITKLKIPDLIVTLSTDLIFRGAALVLAAGQVLHMFPDIIPFIGAGRIAGVPVPVYLGFSAIIIGALILHKTRLGRYALAIGGNRTGAIYAGIGVEKHKIYHYVIMGLLAGFAGIMLTGRLNAVQATVARGFALHTIAAVVVGGTDLFGGEAYMLGTLMGALLLSMATNALIILRLPFFWQEVVSGVIIIISMAFYGYIKRKE